MVEFKTVGQALGSGAATGLESGKAAGGGDFASVLEGAVNAADTLQSAADAGLRGVATGTNVDIHGTMIALEEANIALRAMVSVRDKVVDAYHSLWNMPI